MTDRYVGLGGSDSNDGLSWDSRKLTLNGVEDTPVVAGDTVYVGPGTYREQLTVDVSGSGGSPITYIGDVVGIYTDKVGGVVSITGSDDDATSTRSHCIDWNDAARDYRTFRGLSFDLAAEDLVRLDGEGWDGLIIEECYFSGSDVDGLSSGLTFLNIVNAATDTAIIRRCFFEHITAYAIWVESLAAERQADITIENCIFLSAAHYPSIYVEGAYDVVLKDCSLHGCLGGTAQYDVRDLTLPRTCAAYNCTFVDNTPWTPTQDILVEDYNIFAVRQWTDHATRCDQGANSVLINFLGHDPFLMQDFPMPYNLLRLSEWSDIPSYGCAQSPPSEDFYGITRPTTDSKKTRGAVQNYRVTRETTTVPSGETESCRMEDAMPYQIFIPITGKQMIFSVELYREANYAGTNPQMIIKQPGQSDQTQTDAGSVSTWNKQTAQFKPANFPPYVVMEIRSNNTATSGSYATLFGKVNVK